MNLNRSSAAPAIVRSLLFVLALLVGSGEPIRAETPDAGAAPAARDEQTILTELRAAKKEFEAAMPSVSAIGDEKFRKQAGEKVLPLLQKTADLLKELAAAQKDDEARQGLEDDRCLYLALLTALGNDDAAAILESEAAGKEAKNLPAKSALALGKWWHNSGVAAVQEKVLADYAETAKANSTSDKVALTLQTMAQVGAANDEVVLKVAAVIRRDLTGSTAKKIAADLDPNGALLELLGKPLAVAGRTSTGKAFTVADWKGKVVLVDCWATWCLPCNAEIPHVKELYANFHAKGLEIVGIDCDGDDETVNTFTKQKEMPWTQLREESQTDDPWHPLAKQWGVGGIPTMFLIDKKGVLRYVDAGEETEAKVAKLLWDPLESTCRHASLSIL